MNPPAVFATQVAQLLSLRLRAPNGITAQNAAIAALIAANTEAVTLTWDNWKLRAGDELLRPTNQGILDLLSRMAAHGVRQLYFPAATDRTHLAAVVWHLAQDPAIGDGGVRYTSRLEVVVGQAVRVVPVIGVAKTPARPAAATPALGSTAQTPASPELREAASTLMVPHGVDAETADHLIARFVAATTPDGITRALDAMAALAERPRKRLSDVVLIILAFIEAEPRFVDPELRRSYDFAVNRVATASTLRALAAAVYPVPEQRDEYMRVFAHFGDAAADQLIEQLAHAESSSERRVLYDTLRALKRGVPTLISLLGDSRWYVVRNAAELLGELGAADAEPGLVFALGHEDARVRQSATTSLAKLDTPGAAAALHRAMRDAAPAVRCTAALALGNSKDARLVPRIIRALADEEDPDVQSALLTALATIGTPEAVQYLVSAAEPEKGLFKRKPTPLRIAAITALCESTEPDARAAIQSLARDKERDVRDAATRALTPAKPATPRRRGTTSW
jgi:HEAT repeat protein